MSIIAFQFITLFNEVVSLLVVIVALYFNDISRSSGGHRPRLSCILKISFNKTWRIWQSPIPGRPLLRFPYHETRRRFVSPASTRHSRRFGAPGRCLAGLHLRVER